MRSAYRDTEEQIKNTKQNKEGESEAVSFGGGTTRLAIEEMQGKRSRSNDRVVSLLVIFGAAILALLAIIGLISLFNGFLFSPKSKTSSTTALKVPTNAEVTANAKTPEGVIASVDASTVTVNFILFDGAERYQTGFLISADGYVVTSGVALPDAGTYVLQVFCENEGMISAELVGADVGAGIAVIKLQHGENYVPVALGNSDFVKPGQRVYAVSDSTTGIYTGFSAVGNLSSTSFQKTIPAVAEQNERTLTLLCTDFSLNQTLGGAPLVNEAGQVVGFCTRGITPPFSGAGCAIPVNTLVEIVNEIIRDAA